MIQIDELMMRIPGISEEEGSLIGREVAQRVADALPSHYGNISIKELNIKLQESAIQNKGLLAAVISDEVISRIKQATYTLR